MKKTMTTNTTIDTKEKASKKLLGIGLGAVMGSVVTGIILKRKLKKFEKNTEENERLIREEHKRSTQRLHNKLQETEKELDKVKKESGTELADKDIKIDLLNSEINELNEKIDSIQKKIDVENLNYSTVEEFAYAEETVEYKELLNDFLNCKKLHMMKDDYKIGGNDTGALIKFINLLGNRATFLDLMYQYMELNLENAEEGAFLDANDRKFFKELNEFYKRRFPEFAKDDLIRYTEDKKFDENYMEDKRFPGKNFKEVVGVYLPAIYRLEGGHLQYKMKVYAK